MATKTDDARITEHTDSPGDRAAAFAANLAAVLDAARDSGVSEDVTKQAIESLSLVVRTAP